MEQAKTANRLLLRLGALLLHALLNFIAVSWITGFDFGGSWLTFVGFVLALFVLVYFFLKHLLSFLQFLKRKQP